MVGFLSFIRIKPQIKKCAGVRNRCADSNINKKTKKKSTKNWLSLAKQPLKDNACSITIERKCIINWLIIGPKSAAKRVVGSKNSFTTKTTDKQALGQLSK